MCFGQYQASLAELGWLGNGTAMSTAIVTLTVCEQLVHKYLIPYDEHLSSVDSFSLRPELFDNSEPRRLRYKLKEGSWESQKSAETSN